jgi:hypothetical protein
MKRSVLVAIGLLILMSFVWGQAGSGSKDKKQSHAMKSDAAAEQKVIELEKQLWEAWKNKNGEPFRQNLTDDFVAVTGSGVEVGKSKTVDDVTTTQCDVKSYSLSDNRVAWIDKDTALLTYKADEDATCGGQKLPATTYASSVWQRKGGKWMAVFHQETPAEQSTQPPAQ